MQTVCGPFANIKNRFDSVLRHPPPCLLTSFSVYLYRRHFQLQVLLLFRFRAGRVALPKFYEEIHVGLQTLRFRTMILPRLT